MTQESSYPHQLPPTSAIAPKPILNATTEEWFEYPIRVHPHHTDYMGSVWHGTYLAWMEEARIECLRSMGVDYAELVKMGCELPVIELSLRYHHAIAFGEDILVKTRMTDVAGVRIHWDYRIESLTSQQVCVSGRVTLVAIDRDKKKILRQLPPPVKDVLVKLTKS